jgi:hypothetical protein
VSDGGLFEIPEQPAVHPVALAAGRGPIAWAPVRRARPCDDCTRSRDEHVLGDLWARPFKPVLPATTKREQGGQRAYLCAQHAQLRKEHDDAVERPHPGAE